MQFRKKQPGFTLIELMIVVAIVAVVLVIALPGYQQFTQRSKRGDAKASLLEAQLAQEKWRAEDTDYGTLAELGIAADSISGYYTLAIVANTGSTYTITAAPKTGGPQVGDSCGTFAVNQDGPLYAGYASADCWGR